MACQKVKNRSYNDFWLKVDCGQSYAIIISTKIDCKTIKQQSCNKDWTKVDYKLAKQQLCNEICIKQIYSKCVETNLYRDKYNSRLRKSKYNSSLHKGRYNGNLENYKGELQKRFYEKVSIKGNL